MMFAVEGAKEEGIVTCECLKNLNGRLHFSRSWAWTSAMWTRRGSSCTARTSA